MAGITRFEEIDAWVTSRQLPIMICSLSNRAGLSRDFGLRDQIRCASVSIISNIAEGFESRTDVQFINFLGMARASAGELRSQLYIASDQKYISEEQFKEAYTIVEKCSRQTAGFISYLENNPRQRRRIADDDAGYKIDSPADL